MRSKNVFYNIISNIFLQIIIIFYGFIIPKIIISNFGSSVNGLVSSITQFLAYITLLESGFGPVVKSALYKPISKKDNELIANILKSSERFFRKIALIFVLYILVLCIIFPFLVHSDFGFLYTTSLILIISVSTFFEYFFGITYCLFLQAEQKNYIVSIVQIFTYILSIFVIVVLTKFNLSIHFIKLFSGLIFAIRPLIFNYIVKNKFNIKFDKVNNSFSLKQKWDGLAQHIAYVIHSNTDVTVLTFFVSLKEVSVYSVYYLVIKGLQSLVLSFLNGIDSSFGDMIAKNERENLNNKFSIYESIYYTIITVIFSCSILLITPFIKVYTSGVSDVNYIRWMFGYLLVISQFIWAIRQPYNELIKAAGHFKETRIGAWVEAIVNIVLSVVLVWKFGIIGVTIGTIVAMTIRTIEFMYHTNKKILDRNLVISFKKLLVIIIETISIFSLCKFLPYLNNTSYVNWGINAIMTFFVSFIIVGIINYLLYKKELNVLFHILKKSVRK